VAFDGIRGGDAGVVPAKHARQTTNAALLGAAYRSLLRRVKALEYLGA
jgi:hypothetical protein